MLKPTQPPAIRVTRRFAFSPERVFDAWLDAATAGRWLFGTPLGQVERAETDPRVGGKFVFVELREGEKFEHAGEYLEIDRPRKLVFRYGLPKFSPSQDRVIVEIRPTQEGCELTVTHELAPEFASAAKRTETGWATLVESLAAVVGDERPAVNRGLVRFMDEDTVRVERLLPGPIERVWSYIVEAPQRAKWFAGGTTQLEVGGEMKLIFKHSDLVQGDVPPEKYARFEEGEFNATCKVLECDPPRLYRFFGSDFSDVTFALTEEGSNVRLIITDQRKGVSMDEKVGAAAGWHAHIALMIAEFEGNTPPSFWSNHTRLERLYRRVVEDQGTVP